MKNWIYEVESCLIPLFELSEEYESYAAARGASPRELPETLMLRDLIDKLWPYCLRMAEADCAAEGAADESTHARLDRIERLASALKESAFFKATEGCAAPALSAADRAAAAQDDDYSACLKLWDVVCGRAEPAADDETDDEPAGDAIEAPHAADDSEAQDAADEAPEARDAARADEAAAEEPAGYEPARDVPAVQTSERRAPGPDDAELAEEALNSLREAIGRMRSREAAAAAAIASLEAEL
ncbi:MAG: hypothetical protein II173_02570, partial [Firmicutes bacterium]|nr:hypothetical protein [Bacillota bacterium]